ncbi:MAG: hypothetical protein AB1400_09040 [Pseudomonadota bacterium]
MKNKGYVALLDVLGFSALISSDSNGEKIAAYVSKIESIVDKHCKNSPSKQIEFVIFSDSIVLTTGSDEDALRELITLCSKLLYEMLCDEIALRGCISYGAYIRKNTAAGTFVAGRAIIDAYQFETKQNWVGIMLSPTVIRRVPNLKDRCSLPLHHRNDDPNGLRNLPWGAFVQPHAAIPFHTASPFEDSGYGGFAILPSNGDLSNLHAYLTSLRTSMEKLQTLKSFAPDPAAQKKYQNTYNWLNNPPMPLATGYIQSIQTAIQQGLLSWP